ncbi:Uncharacterized protein APZ42_030165 [Daphnia magna]|uniref:Uncharacterized protein n=1 Tax=Daphnia magna TaxID=35525 RepID=A0A164P070_9CRUS|nr:Uncharacterized protein APZ42_030165 [Daphnia magna]
MDDPLWRDGRPWLLFLKRKPNPKVDRNSSDVVHQSVYELVHSEDREELQRQLTWSSQLAADSGLTLLDALRPDNSMILERSFTVRFRCLLDNTSGFLVRPFFPFRLRNCWNFFEIRSVSHGPGG